MTTEVGNLEEIRKARKILNSWKLKRKLNSPKHRHLHGIDSKRD